ncbi:MAG: Tar ligand binding domain-containing protein, partial [Herbaspirillum sp.]|nr:Tar ligand binding domain-containing protein [Herbaspirillum sp.]
MRNLTVRFSLMSALALFSVMIVVGAGVGIFALGRANQATEYVHEITERALLINDAYKDTTRTRAAHSRIYSTLMEKGDAAVIEAAFKSAQMTYDRSLKFLDDYAKLPDLEGQDPATKTELIESAKALNDILKK